MHGRPCAVIDAGLFEVCHMPHYDFSPYVCSFEIELSIQEIIVNAKESKGAIICPFINLK